MSFFRRLVETFRAHALTIAQQVPVDLQTIFTRTRFGKEIVAHNAVDVGVKFERFFARARVVHWRIRMIDYRVEHVFVRFQTDVVIQTIALILSHDVTQRLRRVFAARVERFVRIRHEQSQFPVRLFDAFDSATNEPSTLTFCGVLRLCRDVDPL